MPATSTTKMQRNAAFRTCAVLMACVVVVLDWLSKALARISLPVCAGPGCSPVKVGGVELLRVDNGGSALGFAQGMWIWTLVAALGLGATVWLFRRASNQMIKLGAALIAGGGLANLVDRVIWGSVTDFIVTGPVVINVADIALALGTVLLSLGLQRGLQPGFRGPRQHR